MPLPEYTGTLGLTRAAHLLRRATHGATKDQIDSFALLTPAEAITLLFRQILPDPVLPPDPATAQPWFLTPPTDANSEEADLQQYFKCWCIGQMLSANIDPALSLAYSSREKVVLFLHTHFTAIQSKVDNSRSLYFQNQLFRLFALDALNPNAAINFKALSVKICIDNAMLRLLDGDMNVKGSPNENYAREFLELYTIGRGLEGTLPPPEDSGDYILFKEQDVQAAAKVLSGWENLDWEEAESFLPLDIDTNLPRGKVKGNVTNASGHDNDPKQFSARFNNTIIQADPALLNGGNPTEASALDEIVQLVDMLYTKPETARNICWKIYRFYVHAPHAIEDCLAIDSNIITEMANTFVANNYKLQPVIENLLRSQHFYEASTPDVKDDNFGSIIKSPIDLVIGTLRFFNVPMPDMVSLPESFYEAATNITSTLRELGMNYYEPYDVAGYEAYHQFPIYHRSWITPNYLARRYAFIRQVVTASENGMFNVNVFQFVKNNFPDPIAADADSLIIELAKYVFPLSDNLTFDESLDDNAALTAQRLLYFKDRFLQQFDESYWTTRWTNGSIDLRDQLEFLFNAMLQSPENQLS
jgi:uncharacterized protein (DUF1800 family)